jgi:predicted HTH domain antitoxin
VFETHRDALHEMSRLIKLAINDLKDEVNKMDPPRA